MITQYEIDWFNHYSYRVTFKDAEGKVWHRAHGFVTKEAAQDYAEGWIGG